VKVALFRWINTAVVLTLITPFTATLADDEHDGIIYKLYCVFWSEIVTTTILQLADISGHINRHILAPRAKSQDAEKVKEMQTHAARLTLCPMLPSAKPPIV
jgi:hypothetical protein